MSANPDPITREYPIMFSAPMVRELLADRKRVTRRLSKQWLKVKAGDRLWVREAFQLCVGCNGGDGLLYRAGCGHVPAHPWKPSIHMPRWASRILLECEEDARLERLWDITEDDAIAEGIVPDVVNPITRFVDLWHSLHTKQGERWEDNPEVVRVGRFRRIS